MPADTNGVCEPTRANAITDPFGENEGPASRYVASVVSASEAPPTALSYERWYEPSAAASTRASPDPSFATSLPAGPQLLIEPASATCRQPHVTPWSLDAER